MPKVLVSMYHFVGAGGGASAAGGYTDKFCCEIHYKMCVRARVRACVLSQVIVAVQPHIESFSNAVKMHYNDV